MSEVEIKEKYIQFFIERFVYSITELEQFNDSYTREEAMVNTLVAFKYLIDKKEDLNLGEIIKLGNKINEFSDTPNGLRKVMVTAGSKAEFTPVNPNQIPMKLNELLYQYYNTWDASDPFYREAKFHIKYMRIHPLEDGNKRSGKLIMASNLWKQGITPAIITRADTDEYYDFINNQDYDKFAEFLEQRSNLESNTMCGFYKTQKSLGFADPVDDEYVKKLILSKSTR